MALYDPVQKYVVYASAASLKVYAPNGAGANTTPNAGTTPTTPPVITLTAKPGTTIHADGSSVLTVNWNITGAYPGAKGIAVTDTLGNQNTNESGSFSYGPYSPGTTGSTTITVNAIGPGGGSTKSITVSLG